MRADTQSAGFYRGLVQTCAAIAGTIALFALSVWAVADWRLLTLGTDSVPMAPSTAWAILLLSVAVFAGNRWPAATWVRVLVSISLFGVVCMSLLVATQTFFDLELLLERWLAGTTDVVGNAPVGRMSPLTAASLLLVALGFWLASPPANRRWWCRQTAAVLALATLLLGVAVTLSYASGLPLLFGTSTIPMALLTAVAIAAMGAGLLIVAGNDTFPLSLLHPTSAAAGMTPRGSLFGIPLLAFLFLAAGIGTVGYGYFTHQVAGAHKAAEVELSAVADLKVQNIVDWRKERLSDARTVMLDAFLGQHVRKFLGNAAHATVRTELLARLHAMREHNQGLRAVLLDPQMNVRLASPEDKVCFGPIANAFAMEALRLNRVVMSDLHRSRFTGEVHLDLAIPLGDHLDGPGAGAPPLGVIVVEVDPEKFLYPHVQNWPTPSRTAETLLFQREGDEVVYLNSLRHTHNTPLSMRLPIDDAGLPAAQAAIGQEGVMDGADYRGVPVLAAMRSIPGTPWFLVAKVDQEELYAPLRERGLTTLAIVLVLVLTTALAVGLLGRRRDTQWLQRQLDLEREHGLILDSTDEGILGLDAEGNCVFINPAACRMLGYEAEQLVGKPGHAAWHHQKADGAPYSVEEYPIYAVRQTGTSCRCDDEVFWRKDGTSFRVEYSVTPSRNSDQRVALVLTFRDITERKRTEELLRHETDMRNKILDNLPCTALVLKKGTREIVYSNEKARKIGAIPGTTCFQTCAKRDTPCPFCLAPEVWSTNDPRRLDVEYEGTHYNGIWVPLLDDLFVHYIFDISDRKRAEAALRESDKRHHVLFESSRDAMMTLAPPSWSFNSCNQATVEMFRAEDKAKFTSLGPWDLSPDVQPDGRPSNEKAKEMIDTAMREGYHFFEWTHKRLDGDEFPATVLLTRVDLDGQAFLQATVRDITAQKRAEKRLQKYAAQTSDLYQQLNSMAGQVRDLMQSVVNEGDYSVRFQNPLLLRCWESKNCDFASCRSFGRTDNLRCWEVSGTLCRGEVQGTFAKKLGDCRQCEVYKAARQDSVADLGESFNEMVTMLAERQQWVEAGNQRLEEAARRAQELAIEASAATRAKSEFLANMSHEIRTPMTAILGYVDLIRDGCAGGCHFGNGELPESLAVIQRNGRHLLNLINDILDLSKVEAGKFDSQRTRCSPRELLEEVVSLMRMRTDAKELQISAEVVGPLPESVLTDPQRLRQILVNLVGNAIKFTDRGEVRITAQLVSDQAAPRLRFDVTDTGIGMTASQVTRLFQPFTQVDSSATRRFGGTGLGLCISKQLAAILGGDIEVRSTPGVGSTFSLWIDPGPLEGVAMIDRPEASSPPAETPSTPTPATLPSATAVAKIALHTRILFAEDGPDNQRLIALVLKKAGAEVTLVENGQLALEAALAQSEAGQPFDVILMDMQMPVMDGYVAVQTLRQRGYAGLIIALTAHAMAEDRQKCLDAGCDDYASKPIDRQLLIATIAQCVSRSGSRADGVQPGAASPTASP